MLIPESPSMDGSIAVEIVPPFFVLTEEEVREYMEDQLGRTPTEDEYEQVKKWFNNGHPWYEYLDICIDML